MAKTRRQELEKWLDNEGWTDGAREVNVGESMGATAFVCGVFSAVVLVITAFLSGDPFSDWHMTKTDEVVPWWEELAGTLFVLTGLSMLVMGLVEAHGGRNCEINREITGTAHQTAVDTYRKLSPDDQARLKKPLLDFLEIPSRGARWDDPLWMKHTDAWTTLARAIDERDTLALQTRAVEAGVEVLELANVLDEEITSMRKDEVT